MRDQKLSVADKPVSGVFEDKLGNKKYAQALSQFIQNCQTPLTIGIQGEWGSGKTSLLNLIKEDLENAEVSQNKRRKEIVTGKDAYKVIWINTWEHALLKSPEECLLSIVEEIISVISRVDGSWNAGAKAKAALTNLAKGALRVGAGAALATTMGTVGYAKGAELADELVGGGDNENSVKALRNSLREIITTIKEREQNPVDRFVVFVDDLDRLDPNIAVQILELLKNIFDVEHSIFVLAIDYQVVVKGLRFKFGEPTEENEWEFRAFFDKIIQLPFMMPMSTYTLDDYITHMLSEEIQLFTNAVEKKLISGGILTKIVRLTLGHNPRALKRLTNALSLINIYNKEDLMTDAHSTEIKQLVFALICLQISFPKIYEVLISNPNFPAWDDEFSNRLTGGPHQENLDLRKALDRAMQIHEDDFDEDWEKALFKIVWLKSWQRGRLVEISRLLSLIKDDILGQQDEEIVERLMKKALTMTSVTAVIANFDNQVSQEAEDTDTTAIKNRINYWREFAKVLKGSQTVFDTNIKNNHFAGYLARRHEDILPDQLQFVVQTGSTSPLKLESYSGDLKSHFRRFQLFRSLRSDLEKASRSKIKFEGNEDSSKQQLIFLPPEGVKTRVKLDDPTNRETAATVHKWIREILPEVESILKKAIDEEDVAMANFNVSVEGYSEKNKEISSI